MSRGLRELSPAEYLGRDTVPPQGPERSLALRDRLRTRDEGLTVQLQHNQVGSGALCDLDAFSANHRLILA